jgi:hypothetical protein
MVYADALLENVQKAGDQIHSLIEDLAGNGPTNDELRQEVSSFQRNTERPERMIAELDRSASNHVFGTGWPSLSMLGEELATLTPDQVSAAMREARSSLLTIVPSKAQVRFAGFTSTDPPLKAPLGGQVLHAMPGKGHADKLYFGASGFSLVGPSGRPVWTIPWSNVAVALWWSDGRYTIIGSDGVAINFFPERWQKAHLFADAARSFIRAESWIPMDEPGALLRKPEPICSVCEATPAAELTIRRWTAQRRDWVHAILCRDCAIAEFRRCTAGMIVWMWLPIYWLFMPIPILENLIKRYQIGKLGTPLRTAGRNPLKKGLPVYLRPAMIAPGVWVVYLGARIFGL